MPIPLRRLPMEPFIDLACSGAQTDTHYGAPGEHAHLARRFDVPWSTWRGWVTRGVPWPTADKLAIEAGSHPALIWGADFYEGCDDIDIPPPPKACKRCGELKPVEDFGPQRAQCRPCHILTRRERRAA